MTATLQVPMIWLGLCLMQRAIGCGAGLSRGEATFGAVGFTCGQNRAGVACLPAAACSRCSSGPGKLVEL